MLLGAKATQSVSEAQVILIIKKGLTRNEKIRNFIRMENRKKNMCNINFNNHLWIWLIGTLS